MVGFNARRCDLMQGLAQRTQDHKKHHNHGISSNGTGGPLALFLLPVISAFAWAGFCMCPTSRLEILLPSGQRPKDHAHDAVNNTFI